MYGKDFGYMVKPYFRHIYILSHLYRVIYEILSSGQLLEFVISIFDPSRLLPYFLVHIKILLQLIWKSGLNWDDELTVELNEKMDYLERHVTTNQKFIHQ